MLYAVAVLISTMVCIMLPVLSKVTCKNLTVQVYLIFSFNLSDHLVTSIFSGIVKQYWLKYLCKPSVYIHTLR